MPGIGGMNRTVGRCGSGHHGRAGRARRNGLVRDPLEQYGQPNLEELFFHLVEHAKAPDVEPARNATSWDE